MQLTVSRDNLGPVLREMMLRGKDPRRALEPMGVALVSLAKRAHTDASLRPYVWPALANGRPSTLQDTTTLRRAWRVVAVSSDGVTVGNDREYAAVHHGGGRTGPRVIEASGRALRFVIGGRVIFRKRVRHPGSDIPKRRALPVYDDGRLTPHAESVLMGIAVRRMGMES